MAEMLDADRIEIKRGLGRYIDFGANIQKVFKPYIVKRKNGQCQVLIPLVELDDLCLKILKLAHKKQFCQEPYDEKNR